MLTADTGIRWQCWVCRFIYRGPGALRNHVVDKHGPKVWKARPQGWIRVCQVKFETSLILHQD